MPTAFGIGNVVATPLVFGLAGVILLGFVLGYSGLGRRIRHPGGLYVQVAAGLGRSAGLGAAALLFLSYTGFAAAMYSLAALLLKELASSSFGVEVPIPLALIISVAIVQGLNLAPLRTVARIMMVVVGIQILAILWFAASALNSPAEGKISTEALDPGWLLSGSFGVTLIFALIGFIGSEGATTYSDELVDPYKSVPKATYLSYGLTTAALVLGSWAVSRVVGAEEAATPDGASPVTVLVQLIGPQSTGVAQHLLIPTVYIGIIATGMMLNGGTARQLAGLARDGILPGFLAADRTSGAPPARPALTVQPILAGTIALSATVTTGTTLPLWLAPASALGVLAVLALASAAATVWFLRGEADEAGFLGWEGQVAAGFFSVLTIGGAFGYGVTHLQQITPQIPAPVAWIVGTSMAVTFAAGAVAAQLLRARRPAVYTAIGGTRVNDERLAPSPVPNAPS